MTIEIEPGERCVRQYPCAFVVRPLYGRARTPFVLRVYGNICILRDCYMHHINYKYETVVHVRHTSSLIILPYNIDQ